MPKRPRRRFARAGRRVARYHTRRMEPRPRGTYRPAAEPPFTKRLWGLCFLGAALLYLITCQRHVSWQDSGMFQERVWHGDVYSDLGLALAHPLYIAAGQVLRLLPGTWFAGGLNFFSGLGAAVALANLAVVVALVTGRLWTGAAVAAMLAVAHTMWWLATIAEVYTWSAAGLTLELLLLVLVLRKPDWRRLALLAGVNGVGLCVHNFALLPLPIFLGLGVWLAATRRLPVWSLCAAAVAWLVGASPYLVMIVQEAMRPGMGPATAVSSALFGKSYADEVAGGGSWRLFKVNAALMALNFVSCLVPLAVIGWVRFGRRLGHPSAVAIGAITAIHLLFVLRYPVPDQFTFVLPSLVMIGLAAGVGLSVLADACPRGRQVAIAAVAVSIALPPAFYAAAPSVVRALGVSVSRARELPRDEARYWLVPWKHDEHSAHRFAQDALRQAAPDGVIVPDSTSDSALTLTQEWYELAPGVTVAVDGELPPYAAGPGAFRAALGHRPLYLVTPAPGYAPQGLGRGAAGVRHEREGVLWRVRWGNP